MTHLFLVAIPVFLLLVPNVYAGGDGKDWYNMSWMHACKYSGQTVQDCENIKDENQGNEEINNNDLGNENMQGCHDDGYEDGQNNPFNQDRNKGCTDYQNMYYKGFIAGCKSAGNTKEICDTFTDQ